MSAPARKNGSAARLGRVMEFTDGFVTHETQYFAGPFDAPAGRSALAEPIPARDH